MERTNQKNFWKGEFGKEYIGRNNSEIIDISN